MLVRNALVAGLRIGSSCRMMSPLGSSTRTTAAPKSPSILVANGPMTTDV